MSEKIKIFIIDDDKFLVHMYGMKFEANDFIVESSLSGVEALEKIRNGFTPDIILLDLIMPGMDGFDILESIKKESLCKGCLLIMLTNQGLASDISKAEDRGVNGYIVKATTIPSEVVEEVKEFYKQFKMKK
ncbi:MAG: response regulator [Minisyncoccia bacterium]